MVPAQPDRWYLVTTVNDVLEFWFPPGTRADATHPEGQFNPAWFQADPAFDEAIRRRFLPLYEQAARGALDGWAASAEGALALVVLLDQFPRNMFRGEPRSFATDGKALAIAQRAVSDGLDQQVPPLWRTFFYLPFEHSEDRAMQARSVSLFRALGNAETTRFAETHRAIIDRFGRFPHRNVILGRESTPQEAEWLAAGGETFGTKT
jgi:uncharacterized protein (DUF924 family)